MPFTMCTTVWHSIPHFLLTRVLINIALLILGFLFSHKGKKCEYFILNCNLLCILFQWLKMDKYLYNLYARLTLLYLPVGDIIKANYFSLDNVYMWPCIPSWKTSHSSFSFGEKCQCQCCITSSFNQWSFQLGCTIPYC